MAETQREPVPRDDDGELSTALSFLRFARQCVLKKTEGLDDADLRRPMVPSGTSLLGLVQHLTDGEAYWFARADRRAAPQHALGADAHGSRDGSACRSRRHPARAAGRRHRPLATTGRSVRLARVRHGI
jgi:hypothetical protein